MKHTISTLVAYVALMFATTAQGAEEIFDVNFALQTNGSSATATSGNAAEAIDGNNDSRWESAHGIDPQIWTLDMGQERIFNNIQIRWEGAYGKTFTIEASTDTTSWTEIVKVEGQALDGFPYEQSFDFEKTTARYIRFNGKERGTPYGYSFYEFRVLLPGIPVLTTFNVTAPQVTKVGDPVDLTVTTLDQNGRHMDVDVSYSVLPEGTATIASGKITALKKGMIDVKANVGILSASFSIFAYEGENLAFGKTVTAIEGSNNPGNAVDNNDGSMWEMPDQGTENYVYDAWMQVDLGDFYNLDLVYLYFEGACSQNYTVQFSPDAATWSVAYSYAGNPGVDHRKDFWYDNVAESRKVRYVKVFSTKAATQYGVKIRELKVYGTAFDATDTERPVISKAELKEKGSTWVSLSVAATDNNEIFAYHVVESAHGINAKYTPTSDGIITVTGLQAETTYTLLVTAVDGSLNESDSKQVQVTTDRYYTVPNTTAPVPHVPAAQVRSLYSDAYEFAPASLNSYNEGWWQNPSLTEEELSGDHFLHYYGQMGGIIGWQYGEIMCPMMEMLHVDIWPSQSGSVTVGPTTGGSVPTIVASKTVQVVGGQWNSFDFDIKKDFPTLDLFHLFQFQFTGYAGQTDLSIDNVYFYRTSDYVDTEAPTDLSVKQGEVSYFGVELTCSAKDNSGILNFFVKEGENIITKVGSRSGAETHVSVTGLKPGTPYKLLVTAVDEAQNSSEAVEVHITTLELTPAPAPDKDAAMVTCLYSDAYTSATGFNVGNWSQTTVMQEESVSQNDKVLLLTNMNYIGWELNTHIDVSKRAQLHIDVYPVNATALSITTISPGDPAKEGEYKMTLRAGLWNSYDIPITSFPTVNHKDLFQIKFFNAAPDGTASMFIDNVYFWGETTGVDEIHDNSNAAVKLWENNRIIILYNGIRYNILGQPVNL